MFLIRKTKFLVGLGFSDAFLVSGPIGMIKLALVAVGAFLAVRTRLGQWGGQLHFLSQKLVQGGTIFTKGIVRWHKPNKEKRGNHQMALSKVIVSHLNHASDRHKQPIDFSPIS